jgi:hypothetical protein
MADGFVKRPEIKKTALSKWFFGIGKGSTSSSMTLAAFKTKPVMACNAFRNGNTPNPSKTINQ